MITSFGEYVVDRCADCLFVCPHFVGSHFLPLVATEGLQYLLVHVAQPVALFIGSLQSLF